MDEKMDPREALALTVVPQLRRFKIELDRAAVDVIRKAEHVREALESGSTINGLGELQRTAQEFDRLCALVSEYRGLVGILEGTN